MSNLNTTGNVDIATGAHRLQYDASASTGTASLSLNKKGAPRVDVHVGQIDDLVAGLLRVKGIIQAVEPQELVVDGVSDVFARK